MWKTIIIFASMTIGSPFFSAVAHSDVFAYPCQPPGVGTEADVFGAGGQFCDGPTEINLSHLHCEGGGFHGGGIGLAGNNGISLGAIGVIGAGGSGCSWRCPDNAVAPQPNPPWVWQHQYIDVTKMIKIGKAFCVKENHLIAAGPTSELVSPDEGLPPAGDTPDNSVMPPRPRIDPHQDIQPPPEPNGSLPPIPNPLPGIIPSLQLP